MHALRTAVTDLLGITTPVVQAPMAGGPTTVELVAAVSEAGGLGCLAGGYLAPAALREQLRATHAATRRRPVRCPRRHARAGALVCDAVRIPVIAAGGVMDGRGLAAVLALGAGAAQLGTAFLRCPEAGTTAPHRRALASARETSVAVSAGITGRLARGVRNTLMRDLDGQAVPPYPVTHALTAELRREAARQDEPERMALWGRSGRGARHGPARGRAGPPDPRAGRRGAPPPRRLTVTDPRPAG